MPTFNEPIIRAVQAVLMADAEMQKITGRKNFRNPALRYILSEYITLTHPERVNPEHIPRSVEADKILKAEEVQKTGRSRNKLGIRYEHMTPLSVLHQKMFEVRDDIQAIDKVLAENFYTALITHEEDKAINASGYRSSVPAIGDRYSVAGIQLIQAKAA